MTFFIHITSPDSTEDLRESFPFIYGKIFNTFSLVGKHVLTHFPTCRGYVTLLFMTNYRENHVHMYAVDTQILNSKHAWIQ